MSATIEQQRYRAGSHSLHIVHQGDLGWAVWLNVEDIDFSGLCLATGATRGDAQGTAIRVLHMLAGVLERPPVAETVMCDECHGHGVIGQPAERSTYGNLYAGNVTEKYVIHGTCTMCGGSGKRTRTGRLG